MPIRVLAALFCILTLLAAPAAAGGIEDCKGLADAEAVGGCLEREFKTAERRLFQAAGALERALGKIDALTTADVDGVAKFRAAHEEWTGYRIRECAFLTAVENWETNSGRDVLECLITETDRRAERYSMLADGLTQRHLD